MGASCKKCGKKVGCGCNLINGLCTDCYVQQQQATITPTNPKP